MKRNIIYIILSLIFFIGSCKEDEVQYSDLGAEFIITSSNFTTLDNAVTINVKTFNVTEPISVTHLGGVDADEEDFDAPANPNLGSITIVDGKGSISIPDTQLGANVIGTSFNLKLIGKNKKGTEFSRRITITVQDPFTYVKPTLAKDTLVKEMIIKLLPTTATVTNVTFERKVSKAGVYATYPSIYRGDTEHGDSLYVQLSGADYNINDTVYFKVTGVADRTAFTETTIVVDPWKCLSTVTVKLDTALNMSYDLVKRRLKKTAELADSADISFTQTDILGGFTMGFTAPENAIFIKKPASEATEAFYALAEKNAINATDFSSPITSDNNVAKGDIFVYRTQRGAGAYSYGVFKIVTVAKPDGVKAKSYIELELKY